LTLLAEVGTTVTRRTGPKCVNISLMVKAFGKNVGSCGQRAEPSVYFGDMQVIQTH
jgi:hypothetical protein